jgi:uncharacterized membrane protein
MRLVKLFLVFAIFLTVSTVNAEEISKDALLAEIDKAQAGQISIDELAEYLIIQAEKSPRFSVLYKEINKEIEGIGDAASGQILKKVKSLVEKGEIEAASSVRALALIIIPEGWEERKRVDQIYKSSRYLEEIKGSRDLNKLLGAEFKFSSDLDKGFFESRLKKTAISFVESAKSQADCFLAFQELALLSSLWGDIGAKEAAVEILDKLVEKSKDGSLSAKDWTFDQPDVQSFIHELIGEDKSRRSKFILLYEWISEKVLSAGRDKRALVYYNWVLGNRPDPDKGNVLFRKRLISASKSKSSSRFVKDRIRELTEAGELSFSDKFDLLLKGYFGYGILYTVFIVLFVVLAAILLIFLKPGYVQNFIFLLSRKKSTVKSNRKAKKGVRYSKAVVEDDEYTRLLAKFGLKEGASEGQIKKAFRRAVKEHHPDAHGTEGVVLDAEGNVDETFQELRKIYDRILEIRSGWFGKS